MRSLLASCASLVLAACGATSCAPAHPDQPTAPTPIPANSAPSVTVAFQGPSTCLPMPGQPCTLAVKAYATDVDSDPLSFVWSGCATGTSSEAVCTVDSLGPVVATVDVSDGHGHTVRASATGRGDATRAPAVQIGAITLIGGVTVELLGNIVDPGEGFLCGAQYCVGATASGACRPDVALRCSCLAGLEADAYRTAAAGTCTVTFTVRNSSGVIGTTGVTFTYPR